MWDKLNDELQLSKQRMRELRDASRATSAELGQMPTKGGGILGFLGKMKGGALAAISAVAGVVRGVGNAFSTIAGFEQANANLSTILGVSVND